MPGEVFGSESRNSGKMLILLCPSSYRDRLPCFSIFTSFFLSSSALSCLEQRPLPARDPLRTLGEKLEKGKGKEGKGGMEW